MQIDDTGNKGITRNIAEHQSNKLTALGHAATSETDNISSGTDEASNEKFWKMPDIMSGICYLDAKRFIQLGKKVILQFTFKVYLSTFSGIYSSAITKKKTITFCKVFSNFVGLNLQYVFCLPKEEKLCSKNFIMHFAERFLELYHLIWIKQISYYYLENIFV